MFYALKVDLGPGMLRLKYVLLSAGSPVSTWELSSSRFHQIFSLSPEDAQCTKAITNALVRRVPASLRASVVALLYSTGLMVEKAIRGMSLLTAVGMIGSKTIIVDDGT